MGAAPAKFDKKWIELDPICILTFTINNIEYNLVREADSFSLYRMPDTFIWATGKISELGTHFRELFDINLFAVDRRNNGYYCPPALLFLPFYIDQDLGWTQPDKQFSRCGQYANSRKKSIDYWTGIRGENYSKMEREKTILEAELSNNDRRVSELVRINKKISRDISFDIFTLNKEEFKKEIDELVSQCDLLKTKQNSFKDEMTHLINEEIENKLNLNIAYKTRDELLSDIAVANEHFMNSETIICPTCGTAHDNSFLERLNISVDEIQCQEAIRDLEAKREILVQQKRELTKTIDDIQVDIDEINEILLTNKNKVTLIDIIRSEGKVFMRQVLNDNIAAATIEKTDTKGKFDTVEGALKRHGSKEIERNISKLYKQNAQKHFPQLGFDNPKELLYGFSIKLNSLQGSDTPRAVLAYYFSLLDIIYSDKQSIKFPIVIDSPNQQDQDLDNLKRMLRFMKNNRPENAQMIVGMVDAIETDFEGTVINIKGERQMLDAKCFDDEYGFYKQLQKVRLDSER